MSKRNALQRIGVLERVATHEADAEILAWGRLVADDDLAAYCVHMRSSGADNGVNIQGGKCAAAISDTELFRIIKPSFEVWRQTRGGAGCAASS